MFRSSSNKDKNKLLRKKEIDAVSLKEDQIEFVKNNKLILKTQQRFKSEIDIVCTEQNNKTT